jgi:hypothetical protein
MFEYGMFNIGKMANMNETCSHCGLKFEVEPGFFYGAMYVSYAFSVAILLTTTFVLYFAFDDPGLWVYIVSVAVIAVITYPVNFRYSRILFLHLFGGVDYDPSLDKDQ